MDVWVDTSALWALLNRRDQFHADARIMWRHISTLGWQINYCRMVHAEFMQHLARDIAGQQGQMRKAKKLFQNQ